MSRKKPSRRASVLLTNRALLDISLIEQFSIDRWGRRVADKYIGEISSALDRLSENPTLLRHEPEFSAGMSFYRIRRHVLVCDHRDDRIVVLTVIHTSMDLPSRLAELEPGLMAEAEFLHAKLSHEPRHD